MTCEWFDRSERCWVLILILLEVTQIYHDSTYNICDILGLNPYSTGSNSNYTSDNAEIKTRSVLILILLEVTQISQQGNEGESLCVVLILILLEVTQIFL